MAFFRNEKMACLRLITLCKLRYLLGRLTAFSVDWALHFHSRNFQIEIQMQFSDNFICLRLGLVVEISQEGKYVGLWGRD